MLEHHGWGWLEQQVTASTTVAGDRRSAEVTLVWADGRAVGVVEVTRMIPVLVCGEPPENAKKSSPEFSLANLQID